MHVVRPMRTPLYAGQTPTSYAVTRRPSKHDKRKTGVNKQLIRFLLSSRFIARSRIYLSILTVNTSTTWIDNLQQCRPGLRSDRIKLREEITFKNCNARWDMMPKCHESSRVLTMQSSDFPSIRDGLRFQNFCNPSKISWCCKKELMKHLRMPSVQTLTPLTHKIQEGILNVWFMD